VIFMDLKMGDLDGFEATRMLLADETTAGIPVIAVTASALCDTRTAAREAGCVDYLPKPVRAEALFASLQRHLGVRFVSGADLSPDGEPAVADAPRRFGIAARLRAAVEVGDITDLEALAHELMSGNAGEGALGRRVGGLASKFDFDGLLALADSLAGEASAT
jgi:DNA-binding LytR/AlgR family response regulator